MTHYPLYEINLRLKSTVIPLITEKQSHFYETAFVKSNYYAFTTLAACGPRLPSTISNWTF